MAASYASSVVASRKPPTRAVLVHPEHVVNDPLSDDAVVALERIAQRYTSFRNTGGFFHEDDAIIQLLRPEIPLWFFNSAVLLRPDVAAVDAALGRFEAKEVTPRFEVMATASATAVGERLIAAGLVPGDIHLMMWGDRPAPATDFPGVEIEEVGPELFKRFHVANLFGFEVPVEHHSPAREFRWWLDEPRHRMFLACLDGEDAGVGMLWTEGDHGYVAAASTRPEHRGNRVQAALIAHRLHKAQEQGCTDFSSEATWGTPSARNLQRAGLRIACTKTVWTRPVATR